ncbi:MAG: hypothetical protein GF334_13410 [Candidatus Altiarchaeales archaeon]|nr:hypothetical protein [Candidatus Altiarchaeales archaeon]
MSSSSIIVTFSFFGIHRWKNAPPQVAFLRNEHRHEFGVVVDIPVNHEDRDLEFFIVKNTLSEFPSTFPPYHKDLKSVRQLGCRSCEMLAEDVMAYLERGGIHASKVTVSEDGENSGRILR